MLSVQLLELSVFKIEKLDVVLGFGHVSASHCQPQLVVIQVGHVEVIDSKLVNAVVMLVLEEGLLIWDVGLRLPLAVALRIVQGGFVLSLVLDSLSKLNISVSEVFDAVTFEV